MKHINNVEQVINSKTLPAGTMVYTAGNASTPQVLLKQLVKDSDIKDIDLLSLLLLGDNKDLFSKQVCSRISHRVLFSGSYSRNALNHGMAS